MNVRFTLLIMLLFVSVAMLVMITGHTGTAQEEHSRIEAKGNTAASDDGPPPKIVFDKDDLVWDMGEVAQGGSGKAIIKFKNMGKGVLKIDSVKAG